jgi:hypothetical protein
MEATFCKKLAFAVVVMALALMVGSGVAWAQITQPTQPVYQFTYFSNGRQILDGKVRIVNGGQQVNGTTAAPGGDLCAMIYVFNKEKMSECCGCLVTSDGGLELSINKDLTNNPKTGAPLTKGVIKLVSTYPSVPVYLGPEICDATFVLHPSLCSDGGGTQTCPTPGLRAWATHIQAQLPNLSFPVSEEEFGPGALADNEVSELNFQCGNIGTSGKGVCSCGTEQ